MQKIVRRRAKALRASGVHAVEEKESTFFFSDEKVTGNEAHSYRYGIVQNTSAVVLCKRKSSSARAYSSLFIGSLRSQPGDFASRAVTVASRKHTCRVSVAYMYRDLDLYSSED